MAAFALPGVFVVAGTASHVGDFDAATRLACGLGLRTCSSLAPLSSLFSYAFSWMPLGSLGFRIAIGHGLLAAVASAVLFRAMLALVRALGMREHELSVPLCLGLTLLCVGLSPVWTVAMAGGNQALVISLCVLVLNIIQHVSFMHVEEQTGLAARWIGLLSLLICFVAWEEPYCAGVLLISAVLSLRHVARCARFPLLLGAVLGLAPGALVVERISVPGAQPVPWLWGIDRATFAIGHALVEPELDVIVLVALLGGLVVLRSVAFAIWPWLVVGALSYACSWLTASSGAATSLWMALALCASAVLICAPLSMLLRGQTERPSSVSLLFGVALCTLGFLQLQHRSKDAMERTVFDAGLFMEDALSELPPEAILLTTTVQTQVLATQAAIEAGSRPDIAIAPLSDLSEVTRVNPIVETMPQLRSVAASLLFAGHLSLSELQTLAGQRPLFLELASSEIEPLHEAVRPAQWFYELLPGGTSREDVSIAAEQRANWYQALLASLDLESASPALVAFLRAKQRIDALDAMTMGAREAAQTSIDFGLQLSPADAEFDAMRTYLADHAQDKELDISPWVSTP